MSGSKCKSMIYTDEFYSNRDNETKYAATRIISELLRFFSPRSMIDVGCGVGTWVNVFQSICGKDAIGLDGDYVNRDYLVIEERDFFVHDLEQTLHDFGRRFDLAISLEVAEHLEEARATSFVSDLCTYSDVILFSAATEHQGGVDHKNEQKLSYWVRLFSERGYDCFDVIRKRIWNDERIPYWYRNNVVLFAKPNILKIELTDPVLDIIHPEMFARAIRECEYWKRENRKNQSKYIILSQWIDLHCRGKRIGDILADRYKKVAIYGYGIIGRQLYEELRESKIDVRYVIDTMADEKMQLEPRIFSLNSLGDAPDVDAIIVTPVVDFERIKLDLLTHFGTTEIIGIDKLLENA